MTERQFIAEIKRLRSTPHRWTIGKIANHLGVHPSQVRAHLHPRPNPSEPLAMFALTTNRQKGAEDG